MTSFEMRAVERVVEKVDGVIAADAAIANLFFATRGANKVEVEVELTNGEMLTFEVSRADAGLTVKEVATC